MSKSVKMPKRFDYSSSAEFNTALKESLNNTKLVMIDCVDMSYIDSAGIGLLVMASKQAQAHGAKLVITNLQSTPKEILQLANLQKIIEIQ